MYVGNLEAYQGVELLVDSFAKCVQRIPSARLGIVGGRAEHCSAIRARTMALGISSQVAVLGPRPVGHLKAFLEAADILAAPRIQGSNTPMKIYSYLHSGRPIVATNLPTHRQVLDPEVAILADPNVEAYAAGLSLALESPELRATLGTAAFERAIRCHSRESFVLQLRELYSKIPGCQHPGGAPLVPSTDDVTAEA
jgi:glycosyltransferase involved in cell wall biosynthesis